MIRIPSRAMTCVYEYQVLKWPVFTNTKSCSDLCLRIPSLEVTCVYEYQVLKWPVFTNNKSYSDLCLRIPSLEVTCVYEYQVLQWPVFTNTKSWNDLCLRIPSLTVTCVISSIVPRTTGILRQPNSFPSSNSQVLSLKYDYFCIYETLSNVNSKINYIHDTYSTYMPS